MRLLEGVVFEAVTGNYPVIRGDEVDLNQIWYNTVTTFLKMLKLREMWICNL